jgi:hypothetical protein
MQELHTTQTSMRTNSTFAAACQGKKDEDLNCFSIFSLQRERLVLGLHGSLPLSVFSNTRDRTMVAKLQRRDRKLASYTVRSLQ